jgi:hypothetical protein
MSEFLGGVIEDFAKTRTEFLYGRWGEALCAEHGFQAAFDVTR